MSPELPDFTTAPAWMDALGGMVTQKQVMDYRGPLSDFSAGSPWAPLMTVKDWAKQRDDIATAAAELSERTLMTASEAMAVLITATCPICRKEAL